MERELKNMLGETKLQNSTNENLFFSETTNYRKSFAVSVHEMR
jgi:hypothetical protein